MINILTSWLSPEISPLELYSALAEAFLSLSYTTTPGSVVYHLGKSYRRVEIPCAKCPTRRRVPGEESLETVVLN